MADNDMMSDDDFAAKLGSLGLSVNNPIASHPDIQSIPDPDQPQASGAPMNPGIGYTGDPSQEASDLSAAPVPPQAPTGPIASYQPQAQLASADPSDKGDEDPEDFDPEAPTGPDPDRIKPNSAIQNPEVKAYIESKFGGNPNALQDALKDAQQTADEKRAVAGFGNALEGIAKSPTALKTDDAFYDTMSKNADSGVKAIEAQQKAKNDQIANAMNQQKLKQELDDDNPDSPMAKKLRDTYTKSFKALGVDASMMDGASPRQMNTYYSKILESANVAEMRKEAQAIALAAKQDKLDKAEADKNSQMQDKISKEVNNLNASSRNALGSSGRVLTSADRALAVLNQKVVTPQDFNAVAADVSTLINGQATISGSHGQEYKNGASVLADLSQKIGSGVVDVNSPEVKQHLRDVITGMRKVSSGVANANLNIVKVTHPEFASKNPEYFDNVAKAFAEQSNAGSMMDNTPDKPAVPTPTVPAATAPATPMVKNNPVQGTQVADTSPTPPSISNDSVKVISPEGKMGSIPKSNLAAALNRGFKVAQ